MGAHPFGGARVMVIAAAADRVLQARLLQEKSQALHDCVTHHEG